jgi:histidinol-phosphate phosphatase family protein
MQMNTMIPFHEINSSWTLFLDRDGVINHQKENGYINTPSEFEFYEGVKETIAACSLHFGKIIVVTNQRGVGKGITTNENLELIHQKMSSDIKAAGGRIDGIYYCTDINNDSLNRKPNTGMAFQAKADFPEINFSKSIMIGNSLSDLQFGKKTGMLTVFLTTTNAEPDEAIIKNADFIMDKLKSLSGMLKS